MNYKYQRIWHLRIIFYFELNQSVEASEKQAKTTTWIITEYGVILCTVLLMDIHADGDFL